MRFLIRCIPLLFCLSAFAADPTVRTAYIRPGGNDPGNHIYGSLSAAEDGEDGTSDLISRNEIMVFEIDGDWTSGADTTPVTFASWFTDATRYIEIRVAAGSRHSGKWTPSAYRLEVSGSNALILSSNFILVYGLQIAVTASSGTYYGIGVATVGTGCTINIGNCIIKGVLSGTGVGYGVNCSDADATINLFNSIIYDFIQGTTACRALAMTLGTVNVYNCTTHHNYVAYREQGGTLTTYNCLSQDTDGWNGTIDGDYNVSDQTNDAPSASYRSTQATNVTFTDEANDDFHTSDANVVDDGTSDPSSGKFSDDIDYQTRSGSWDIGADEYQSAAAVWKWIIRPTISD